MAKGTITDNKNVVSEFLEDLDRLNGTVISAGVHSEDNDSFMLMIANVHEFGLEGPDAIDVTPKMRAWFAWKGYPLKASTTKIEIPEREYIRPAFDELRKKSREILDAQINNIIERHMSAETAAERIGLEMKELIFKHFGEHGDSLSDMTVEMKGSSKRLIDRGAGGGLKGAITFQTSL